MPYRVTVRKQYGATRFMVDEVNNLTELSIWLQKRPSINLTTDIVAIEKLELSNPVDLNMHFKKEHISCTIGPNSDWLIAALKELDGVLESVHNKCHDISHWNHSHKTWVAI